jgi:hypothetical protein
MLLAATQQNAVIDQVANLQKEISNDITITKSILLNDSCLMITWGKGLVPSIVSVCWRKPITT